MSDPVKAPYHYAGDGVTTCKVALKSMMRGTYCYVADKDAVHSHKNIPPDGFYWWGCAFKYLWRWNKKNGVQDLEKCIESIENLIAELKEGEND